MYRQCELKKGDTTTIIWIDERYAKLNKVLKIKKGDVWEAGWVVISVGSVRVDESEVNDRSQDYKRQRKASDI